MALSTVVATGLTNSLLYSSRLSHSLPSLTLFNFARFPLTRQRRVTPLFSTTSRRSLITMAAKNTAPYGSWKSPITADVIAGGEKRLGGVAVDGHGRLILLESRPTEGGRGVLIREADSDEMAPVDITPKEFSVRSRAQEYGGGAFAVSGNKVVFSNNKDQRLYLQSIGPGDSSPSPITPDYGGPTICYADGVFDPRFPRFITVMEDQRLSHSNPVTTIAAITLGDHDVQEPKILISGNDFYAFPRVDSKGKRIAWIEWGHPNMPWDRSELWVGYISENGDVYKRICVTGGDGTLVESPTEPKWTPEGMVGLGDNDVQAHLWFLLSHDVEAWLKGRSYVGVLDDAQSSLSLLDIPFTDISNITLGPNCLYIEGGSASLPLSVAKVSLDDQKRKAVDFSIMWSSSPGSLKYDSYFSLPELIEFPTGIMGQTAYAYFYPPTNPAHQAVGGEKPPLLLKSHGGPTAETSGILNLSIQYWTSRGWAFVDVNYGGSTGYGREYRERLFNNWGIVDVDNGKVDGDRLCITGGSAGGYTTLAALAFKETFKAGASLYGVADLNLLRAETHKFESRYIDNLVGDEKAYHERSPINFVDKFSCPIILFQGLEDKVVPPDQARAIYKALKEKGLPVALVEYEGEQHGFRKAENIKFTLEQQIVFFARTIGNFKVADDITPIKIDNFD
uniref:Peptidase S9 prolyl oligopeptidase catalytic domain-containing protein n=1 Tax=Chenopodium quinoa TaxID=63459 RepID=A0A803M2L5_CHEQI